MDSTANTRERRCDAHIISVPTSFSHMECLPDSYYSLAFDDRCIFSYDYPKHKLITTPGIWCLIQKTMICFNTGGINWPFQIPGEVTYKFLMRRDFQGVILSTSAFCIMDPGSISLSTPMKDSLLKTRESRWLRGTVTCQRPT